METIMQAILDQPNLDPKFKPTAPLYYETLPARVKNPVRDEIERIVPMATLQQTDALERLVDRITLDRANEIVGRLQKHKEGR